MLNMRTCFEIIYQMKDNGVILYGAGRNAEDVYYWMINGGISIRLVLDKYKKGMFHEFGIISPEEELDVGSKTPVLIITVEGVEEKLHNEFSAVFKTIIDIQQFRHLKYFFPDDADDKYAYSASFPFNHYESPFMPKRDLSFWENTVNGDTLEDIETSKDQQPIFWNRMSDMADDFFSMINGESCRFKKNNNMFCCCDALALYRVLIDYHPNKVIEIGSGWSTCLMLDTKEYRLDYKLQISCIEPFPGRLCENIRKADLKKIEIKKDYVQNVSIDYFDSLESGDILFIDSSHVLRNGGDLPYEYFRILPRLKKGVLIHIHDIFYPFTYPKEWIKQGRSYNEAYLVRALLSGNKNYQILYFGDMLFRTGMTDENDFCVKKYPELNDRGGSLWLMKR